MVIPLRSGRQNHPLGLSESTRRHGRDPPVLRRDPRAVTTAAPLRHQAGGAGSRRSRLAQDDDTTAQFTAEGQSFLRPSSLPRSCGPDPELAGCWGCSMLRITVWLPVRVLPAPPRTPTLTEISRGLTNTRGFAGTQGGLQSLLGRRTASEAVRGVLSLATKNRFPGA